MIIYGVLTDTSVPQLYMAGIIPGLVLAGLFTLLIIIICSWKKSLGGRSLHYTWAEKVSSLPSLLPPIFIFVIVVGAIYGGFATPTESAALGVVGSLAIAFKQGRLSYSMIKLALEGTVKTSSMVLLIIICAYFLNFVLSGIGLTDELNKFITELNWSPSQTILAIVVFYLILGCFMETLSMMITTVPIITPIVVGMGYDPIWFGILLMVLLETALISPPIGLNLYVVQGVRERGRISDVMLGVIPFFIAMIAVIICIPDVVMWLPNAVYG
jgi:C4-dicarboxylate transporter DctM subunit